MEKSCKTCCNYPGEGVFCGGMEDCWEPKDVNMAAVQNDLLKFSDICLGACSDKSCSTCKHGTPMSSVLCHSVCFNYSLWEPEESDIHTAQERSCVTCNKDVSSDCAECGDSYFLWEPKPSLTGTQKKIAEICDEVRNILLEKNRKYGDSAINPKRVFSKASPIEQINVRLDDKLSRILSAQDDDTEDAELDLIGYLILKRVAKSVGEGN